MNDNLFDRLVVRVVNITCNHLWEHRRDESRHDAYRFICANCGALMVVQVATITSTDGEGA